MATPYRICFVCLGNICRSPTAEGVMQDLVDAAGLRDRIELDSAGTGAWHVGAPPDDRASAEAQRRGLTLTSRGRQVSESDFFTFDLLVAMDHRNLADLRDLAPDPALRDKVVLLRSFDTASRAAAEQHGHPESDFLAVPDPYYGGDTGFADVFDIVDAGCRGLLAHVVEQLDRPG
jgi:protein-tyrosine phosphatase